MSMGHIKGKVKQLKAEMVKVVDSGELMRREGKLLALNFNFGDLKHSATGLCLNSGCLSMHGIS